MSIETAAILHGALDAKDDVIAIQQHQMQAMKDRIKQLEGQVNRQNEYIAKRVDGSLRACKTCEYWWKEHNLCTHPKTRDGHICCLECTEDHFCGYWVRKKPDHKCSECSLRKATETLTGEELWEGQCRYESKNCNDLGDHDGDDEPLESLVNM